MMTSNNKRKQYSRYIPYLCHFCQRLYNKNDLLLIHLPNTQTVVKTCLKCREIIDRKHEMETEKWSSGNKSDNYYYYRSNDSSIHTLPF